MDNLKIRIPVLGLLLALHALCACADARAARVPTRHDAHPTLVLGVSSREGFARRDDSLGSTRGALVRESEGMSIQTRDRQWITNGSTSGYFDTIIRSRESLSR